jgi:hypothetical protein
MNITKQQGIEYNPNIENKTTPATQFQGRKIELTIGSLNPDTNLLLETSYNKIFPEYTAANRMPSILEKLNKMIEQGVDIFCIQEGRKCTDKGISVNSVDPIVNHLVSKSYACEIKHYNNSGDKAFQYITALNTDKFDIVKSERILLSENGKEFYPTEAINDKLSQLSEEEKQKQLNNLTRQHYFNQAHPRSIFITEATHKETAQQIFTINVHLGVFPESHKSKSIEFIIKQVNELQQQHPDSVILLAGDFNSFADLGGIEQTKMLTDAGFKELSATIKHPNGNDFYGNSTFIAYPYDYASYNADDSIRGKLNAIKDGIKQAEAEQPEANSATETKLKELKDKMVAIFDECCLKAETSATDQSSALYPVTGQLDHIFATSKNRKAEVSGEATLQIYDTELNTIPNSREAVIEHVKNSLKNNTPSVATDHQGIISKVSITIDPTE